MEKAQTEKKRKRRTAEELLEDVRRKKLQMIEREKQLLARTKSSRRKEETHAKILAGAALIEAVKAEEAVALIVFKDRQQDYQIIRLAFPGLPDVSWQSLPAGVPEQRIREALARFSQPSSLQKK